MNKKKYIIVISLFAVYLFILILFLIINQIGKKYIVFYDDFNLVYEKDWKIIENAKIPEVNFSIVENGKYLNKSKITDELEKNITSDNKIFAYKGFGMGKVEYSISEFDESDFEYVNNIIKENNYDFDIYDSNYNDKYEIDLNKDGFIETIYNIGNSYDDEGQNIFSLTIIKGLDDNIILSADKFSLLSEIYSNNFYFINIDNDDSIEMILKKVRCSLGGQEISIYSFKNNSLDYKIIYKEEKNETKN